MRPEGRLAECIRREIDAGAEVTIPVVVLAAVFAEGSEKNLRLGDLEAFAARHGWVIAKAVVGKGLTFRPAGEGGKRRKARGQQP